MLCCLDQLGEWVWGGGGREGCVCCVVWVMGACPVLFGSWGNGCRGVACAVLFGLWGGGGGGLPCVVWVIGGMGAGG